MDGELGQRPGQQRHRGGTSHEWAKSSLLVLAETSINCNVKISLGASRHNLLETTQILLLVGGVGFGYQGLRAELPPPAPAPTPAIVTAQTFRNIEAGDFIGAVGCSSSLCHGGGPAPVTNQVVVVDGRRKRNAFSIWRGRDAHAKSWATLATERSNRMSGSLGMGKAQDTARCTECHAPLQAVSASRLGPYARVDDGISCESCHGPAREWVRTHTRLDLSHAQRLGLGMRDLDSLYNRANNCVSCHQVLPPDIQKAGHPPLIFELDAQSVAEPKHWVDKGDFQGPQAWLVGQATALREMSWALNKRDTSGEIEREQWRGLVWLMRKTTTAIGELPKFENLTDVEMSPGNFIRIQGTSDDIAKAGARMVWDAGMTRRLMDALVASDGDFTDGKEKPGALQYRAVRLTLALSRLLAPLQARDKDRWAKPSEEMEKLFAANDARVEFDPKRFVEQLRAFGKSLAYAGSDDAPPQTASR